MESRGSQKRKAVPEDDNELFVAGPRTSKLMRLSSSATTHSFDNQAPEAVIASTDPSLLPQTPGTIDAALRQDHRQRLAWSSRGHQLHQVAVSGHAQVNVGDQIAFEGTVTQHIHGHLYQQTPGQEKSFNDFKAALDLQQTALSEQSAMINRLIANITFEEFDRVEGKNVEAILLPLLAIEPEFAKALATLAKEGTMVLSPAEMEWLIDEFENLYDMGHDARKRSRQSSIRRTGLVQSARASQGRYRHQSNSTGCSALATERRKRPALSRTCTLKTRSGNLHITLQRSRHEGSDHHSQACAVQLSYYPTYDLPDPTGFTAMFFKHADMQCVYRQLIVFNNIGRYSELEDLINNDNVQALRNRLIEGTASIYDCDDGGDSLVTVCDLTWRFVLSAADCRSLPSEQKAKKYLQSSSI